MSDVDAGSAPLSGIRVVELAQVLAGPFCGQQLADAGADVIKVEPPTGDGTRHWGPPYVPGCEPEDGYPGDSAYFSCCNRNKRSVAVDLRQEHGRAVVRRLIDSADVVIENAKKETMTAWGLTHEQCQRTNRGLVWVTISGYGATGPDATLPGYDFAIQAAAGLMSITGPVGGPPTKVGVAISDLATGATAAIGVLAALAGRERGGKGRLVEVSLLETQVSWLANVASNYLASGEQPQRFGNAHANVVPYELFEAADRPIALAVGNDAQFARMADVLGQPEWARDDRYATNRARLAHREALVAACAELFSTQPAAHWIEVLGAANVPVELVRTVGEALNHRQVRHRELIEELDHPVAGPQRYVTSPIRFNGEPGTAAQRPPMFSEHTREVLAEAGFANEEIDDLIRRRAVIEATRPQREMQGAAT